MSSSLQEPKADLDMCYAHEDTIHKFDVFASDSHENQPHYDTYAGVYDTMQQATGFNDPYELALVFLALNLKLTAKIVDFGCGTGLLGENLKRAGF